MFDDGDGSRGSRGKPPGRSRDARLGFTGRAPHDLDVPTIRPDHLGSALAPSAPVGLPHLAALESLTSLAREGGGDLTDAEVLEVVAAWSRQVAHAESMVRSWAAALSRRESNSPTFVYPDGRPLEDAADELRFRLGVSRRRGQQLIDEGRALTSTLWPVHEALDAGWIDAGKSRILTEMLGEQSVEVAIAVCDEVLPVASELDHAALRRRVQGLLIQVDPDRAGERTERATRKRRVNAVRPLPDGQALFSAVLPAPAAVALAQACEAAARAARAAGDGRTLEQLRADVLAALGANALDAGEVALPTGTVRFSGRTAIVRVVATRAVQEGRPSPVSAVSVVERDLWTEPEDEGSESGGRRRADLDPGDDPFVDREPHLTHRPGIDAPELVGYGAIPPAMARELMDGPRWLRVDEPVAQDESPPPPTEAYRPTAELDTWVRLRDQTCVVPGCHVPTASDDVDHVIPWPTGPTSGENLHTLCRRDHRLKTHGRFRIQRLPDGTTVWRTRLGQELRSGPDGVVIRYRNGVAVPPRVTHRPRSARVRPERLAQMLSHHEGLLRHGELPHVDDDAGWAGLEALEDRHARAIFEVDDPGAPPL
ncbi:HNH endonuclease signature motif containing protein [Serinibacter arcticus]|nr:HNH endonuclease signature motif containing protein [Serinibacter arcticus]